MIKLINKKVIYVLSSIVLVLIISLLVTATLNVVNIKDSSTQEKKCSEGYIKIPGNNKYNTSDFCVMKYEAKDSKGKAASFAESKPWVNVSQIVAMDLSRYACSKCHLITESEWMTIAYNLLSNSENWSTRKVGVGYIYSGHNDNNPISPIAASSDDNDGYFGTDNAIKSNQKRTLKLSNGEVIWDFAGNAAEWTDGQTTGGQPGAVENENVYSWKDWSQLGFEGYLPIKPFPSYNNMTVNWNYEQGLGRLYSNSGDGMLKTFYRGGSYQDGDNAGIFSLNMSGDTTTANPLVGFRVVYELK